MRIIAYIAGHSGPTYHRITMPLNLMRDVNCCISNNPEGKCGFERGCDIFLYNRILPDDLWQRLPALKSQYGFRVGLDIDDYWELDPEHILYEYYQEIGFATKQIEQLRAADFVLTTNSRLAAAVAEINPNVEVCENAIPRKGQFDIEREPHYLTRLFWQGSVTHERDISILHQPIDDLRRQAGKIKMVIAGYEETEEAWQKMTSLFTGAYRHQYRIIPGVHVANYYAPYKEADICLVPLIKSRFNGYKSNLKILEAANLSLPVIASEVDPYLGMPLLYCKKGSEWGKHIGRLLKSKKRQREIGHELAEFCREHYDFDRINAKRKQIFEYEAGK